MKWIFFHYRINNSYIDIFKMTVRGPFLENVVCEDNDYPCFWSILCVYVCVCTRLLSTAYYNRSRRVTGMNKTQFHLPGVNNLVKLKTDTSTGHHISEVANPAPRGTGQACASVWNEPNGMTCESDCMCPIWKGNQELGSTWLLPCSKAAQDVQSLWFLKSSPNVVLCLCDSS